MNFNNGEYGQKIYANFGVDVSAATGLSFNLQPMIGDGKDVDSGVALGTADITVDDQDLLANQYIEYTLVDGDLTKPGQWRHRGELTLAGVKMKSDYVRFTVLP